MASDLTGHPYPHVADPTGLGEPDVRRVAGLVEPAPEDPARGAAACAREPGEGRQGVIGVFEHLGVRTPTLEEFEEARAASWAGLPRESADRPK